MNNSLITKYRPTSFKDVVGHTNEIKAIKEILKKKLSRSFIFNGPSGLGKTTLARIIANEVNCPNPIDFDAASHSGVEDIRQILSGISYKPLDGKSKVYIIDETQKLSSNAWDALLKSIEEPPEHVYFILCTTVLDKVPSAIKTRCSIITLKPISEDDIFNFLVTICENEKFDPSEDVLDLLAIEAGGSPRQALSYLSICHDLQDKDEAATLISKESNDPAVIDLCRLLVKDELTWEKTIPFIKVFKESNPESIRIQIVNYLSVVIQNKNDPSTVCKLLTYLQAFSTSYNQSDKMAPLLLSLGAVIFGE